MKKLSDLTNRIVSSSASLVALIALGTSLYEARLNRAQQRASVWPYVTQGNSDSGGHFSRIVQNAGMGPALVRSFRVRVNVNAARGDARHPLWRTVKRWGEAMDSMGVVVPPGGGGSMTSSIGRGTVLRAGDALTILSLPDPAFSRAFRAKVNAMETVVCYCSLYGECWRDSSEAEEPQAVDACADDPALEFER